MRGYYLRKVSIFVVAFALLIAIFSLNTANTVTYADGEININDAASLQTFLTKLRDRSSDYNGCIVNVGTSQPIDMGSHPHGSFSLVGIDNISGADCNTEIYINVPILNVVNYQGDSNPNAPHYGLFTGVEGSLIWVYYKVNFDFGVGSGTAPCSYYRYSGVEINMPNVTAPDGKKFIGWVEEGSSEYITKISATTWGVKNYVAIYEDDAVTPEIPEGPENDPEPISYPVVYENTLDASGIDTLTATYTTGEEITLGSIEKEGFIFGGWSVNGAKVERLEATLQEGLLADDGKIYLSAVWELESPVVGGLSQINKKYDGNEAELTASVSHPALNELSVSYSWYKVFGEGQTLYSNESSIKVKNVSDSGSYKVVVKVTHASGLTKTVESEVKAISITKAMLSVVASEGAFNLSKIYDGTTDCDVAFNLGEHYLLNGVVANEEISTTILSKEYTSKNAGDSLIKVVVGITGDEAVLSNYEYQETELSFGATINKKEVTFEKLSSPEITKIYDGTDDVNYQFIEGTDYSLSGFVENVDYTLSAKYTSKSASKNAKVILSLNYNDDNHVVSAEALEYDAVIEKVSVSLIKLSSPDLTKSYDGTKEVEYSFQKGVDFSFKGAVYDLSCEVSASYESAVANDNTKVIVNVSIDDENHALENSSLEYKASIARVTLTAKKLSAPSLVKEYDGTVALNGYEFTYGVDFVLEGAAAGEIEKVNYVANFDNESISAQKVVLVLMDVEFSNSASASNYDYYSGTIDLYYDATITPKEIVVSGESRERNYEEKEDLVYLIPTGVMDETVKIKYLREGGNGVGEYLYVGAEFMAPVNANYSLKFEGKGYKYTINKSAKVIAFPTFVEREYDPSISLIEETLIDAVTYEKVGEEYLHKYGIFKWTDGSIIPSALSETGYEMTFVPYDVSNYDYSAMEGYDAINQRVTKKVVLKITQATPTAPEVEDEYVLPVGSRYNNIALPSGWSFNVTGEITSASVVNGEVGSSKIFENALQYTHDESNNYKRLYKDITIYFVATEIIYTCEGEISRSGNFVSVERTPNEEIKINIELINPFEKAGYKVDKWVLSDGTEIPYSENNTYHLTKGELIAMTLTIEVVLEAREDVKVTFKHFYESASGKYLEEECMVLEGTGTSDTTVEIKDVDVKNKLGFTFVKCALTDGEETNSYVVSPLGDTIIEFYYARKTIVVEYVDNDYAELNPEGSLPNEKTVKFGVSFEIDQPLNYQILGYDFVCYKVGGTPVYNLSYTVNEEVEKVTFVVEYRPRENVLYYVYRWIDGEVEILKNYGKVGETVNVENMAYVGYERTSGELENLSGVITGHIVDENGEVVKGSILSLHIYFKKLSYVLTLPEGLGSDVMQKVRFGETVTLPSALASEGLEFLGWEVNGEFFLAGATFQMPATNVEIKPVWKEATVSDEGTQKEGINPGVIIGIVGGAIAFLIIVSIISAVVAKRQKNREKLISKLKIVNRNMFKK